MNIADFPPEYQKQIRRKIGLPTRPAVPSRDVESDSPDEHPGAVSVQAARPFGRVRVRVLGRRHRLCDPDGQSVKAVLDGLVEGCVLRGDSSEFIAGVEMLQEKIPTTEPEETVVELYEVN